MAIATLEVLGISGCVGIKEIIDKFRGKTSDAVVETIQNAEDLETEARAYENAGRP